MMSGQAVIKECTQPSKLKAFIFSGDHLQRLQQAANDIRTHLQTLQALGIGLQVDTISKISQISSSVSEFSSKIDHRHDELKDLIMENSHNTSQRLKALEIMVRSSLVANGKDLHEQVQEIADHAEEIRNAKGFNDTRMLEWAIQMSKIPESIICPISHDVMEDPVLVVQSGITYDHSSLCNSLLEYPDLDPNTNTRFNTMITFVPNVSIRQILMQHFGYQAYKKYDGEGLFQSQYRKAWAEKILGQDEEVAITLDDETNDGGETNGNGETEDNGGAEGDGAGSFWKKKCSLFLLAALVLVNLVVEIVAVIAGGSGNGGGDTPNILKPSNSTEASDTCVSGTYGEPTSELVKWGPNTTIGNSGTEDYGCPVNTSSVCYARGESGSWDSMFLPPFSTGQTIPCSTDGGKTIIRLTFVGVTTQDLDSNDGTTEYVSVNLEVEDGTAITAGFVSLGHEFVSIQYWNMTMSYTGNMTSYYGASSNGTFTHDEDAAMSQNLDGGIMDIALCVEEMSNLCGVRDVIVEEAYDEESQSASPSTPPSADPSASPSSQPSMSPSNSPSLSPSVSPTASPSDNPSSSPTEKPSSSPSRSPSESPSANPPTFLRALPLAITLHMRVRIRVLHRATNPVTSPVPILATP